MATCFFHTSYCTVNEIESLHGVLPASHEYGDRKSTLANGQIVEGREAHDALCAPSLRMKCRKRCTLIDATCTHVGSGAWRVPLKGPAQVLLAFVPTVDWHAVGLDAESTFLKLDEASVVQGPRIGPYTFNFTAYVASVYEDICMSLDLLRQAAASKGRKLHIKLVPLGIGPTVRTRFGDYLAPTVIPAYLTALQYACNAMIHDGWVEALEFVDHTGGTISPFVNVRRTVKIISGSTRDALDFAGARGLPTVLAPCDAFSRIGGLPSDKNLASTLANNSNLRDQLESLQFQAYVPQAQ